MQYRYFWAEQKPTEWYFFSCGALIQGLKNNLAMLFHFLGKKCCLHADKLLWNKTNNFSLRESGAKDRQFMWFCKMHWPTNYASVPMLASVAQSSQAHNSCSFFCCLVSEGMFRKFHSKRRKERKFSRNQFIAKES